MSEYIFTMQKVAKVVRDGSKIIEDISLSFFYGAKIGILGANGAGKSTLLRLIAGEDKEYLGEIVHKKGIKIGYLAQEPRLNLERTVKENVEEGVAEVKAVLDRFNAISDAFANPMTDDEMQALLDEQATLQNKIDALGAWDLDRKLEIAADALRLPDWNAKVAHLSGGEKRRVALCKLLMQEPDLLLLDEPTNHLDAESVAWLERFLKDFKGTIIAITHDRYFLDNVAEWILEIDRGRGIPFKGNYTNWLEQKEERLSLEQRQEANRQKTIKSELEWIRSNPKARQSKNKARIARFEEISTKEYQRTQETQEIYIPPGPRLGDLVLEVKNISKSYGDRVIFENLSFSIPKGAIVGIIGPNGVGKTTLFKLIAKEDTPDSGSLRLGDTVKLAYVSQLRDDLNGENTVFKEIANESDYIQVAGFQMPSRAYIGRFNFKGTTQQKLIRELSGGERNRVHLAKLLTSGGNFLLLDEPSNDLDVATLRALEEALLNFPGCAMVVSHDRWFLDRIATHILAFEDTSTGSEGSGNIEFFEGNFQEYEENRIKRLGKDALQPHRVKYKKLVTVN